MAAAAPVCAEDWRSLIRSMDTTSLTARVVTDEGAIRDFKADFHAGLYAAEEEIAAGKPTWWVAGFSAPRDATDAATGLPIRFLELSRDEWIGQMQILARLRGHNRAIKEYLALPQDQRERFEATDPTREELDVEEAEARKMLEDFNRPPETRHPSPDT